MEEKEDIRELYKTHRKQRSLPEYWVLEKEFHISEIDDYTYLLKKIRNRINSHIEEFVKIIEDLISPDNNFKDMSECKILSKELKEKLLNTYKKLMYKMRWSAELDLLLDEDKDAEYINEMVKDWPTLKKELHEFILLIKESWKKEESNKDNFTYFG